MKVIKQFRGQHSFLSNFYSAGKFRMPHPETGEMLEAKTAEHMYQCLKVHDRRQREWILNSRTALQAKRRARGADIREDWARVKFRFMGEVIRAKFKAFPELAEKLVWTYPARIEEWNDWADRYWGIDIASGRGENRLGEILMEVRSELWEHVPGSVRKQILSQEVA